jgi:hypothetical protein
MKLKNTIFFILTVLVSNNTAIANGCKAKYSNNIVHYADEHNPHNHIITLNYKNMELLDLKYIEGSTNHHADPMGTLKDADYMMLVPKGSYFVHFYDLKNAEFVKKIRLPFKPRSADAYNKKYNLVLLNSRNRPAAVLIDVNKLKIVGKAGFNILCSHDKPQPISPRKVYNRYDIYDKNFQCLPVDFGGDQISGHPIWISSEAFVLLDRANRLLHVYQIKKLANGEFDTKLIQTIKTDTSLHQLIPQSSDEKNIIFYGMTEGNINNSTVAGVYKFIVKNNKLNKIAFKKLKYKDIYGINGHNLYITPDKKYLYAPAGATLKVKRNRYFFGSKNKSINNNYKNYIKLFLGNKIEDKDIYNHKKVSKLFHKFSQIDDYTPTRVPNKNSYMANNYYSPIQYELQQSGAIYVIDTRTMQIIKEITAGKGAGHVAFSKEKNLAVVTNHLDNFLTIIDYKKHQFVTNVNLDFEHENIFNLSQSHMQYIDESGKYYYNFWSDGGVFFRLNLDTLNIDSSVYVGGIPIQGNFYKNIKNDCSLKVIDSDDGYDKYFLNLDNKEDRTSNKREKIDFFKFRTLFLHNRD